MTTIKARSLFREMYRSSRVIFSASENGVNSLRHKVRKGFEQEKGFVLSGKIQPLDSLQKGFNTLHFLRLAEDPKSREKRLLKSLCIMEHYKNKGSSSNNVINLLSEEEQKAYAETMIHYQQVVDVLNNTSGLCLN